MSEMPAGDAQGYDGSDYTDQGGGDYFGEAPAHALYGEPDPVEALQQQVYGIEQQRQMEHLVTEMPEIVEHLPQVQEASHAIAQHIGAPQLAGSPAFMRLVYMAGSNAQADHEAEARRVGPLTAEQIITGSRGGERELGSRALPKWS